MRLPVLAKLPKEDPDTEILNIRLHSKHLTGINCSECDEYLLLLYAILVCTDTTTLAKFKTTIKKRLLDKNVHTELQVHFPDGRIQF